MSRFKVLQHENGTRTLVDCENDQAMHSRVGPVEEARIVYAEASRVSEKLARAEASGRGFVLHDVGMGTAANAIAAIEACALLKGRLHIQSFENVPDGLTAALNQIEHFSFLKPYASHLWELIEKGRTQFSVGGSKTDRTLLTVEWDLLVGDYFTNLARAEKPDLIYYDFYSPKVVPDLWTESRFRAIREHFEARTATDTAKGDDCELYTYSAATPVRLAMLLGGWFVGRGLRTEVKTETSVAATRIDLLQAPLGQTWTEKLKISSSVKNDSDRERGFRHPQFR